MSTLRRIKLLHLDSSNYKARLNGYLQFLTSKSFIRYTILPILPLLILAVIATDPYIWISSEIHHFYIELMAVIFAGVIGFYYILHARNLNDKFSLFIGIGFSVSSCLDLFHVVVSYSMMEDVDFLKYFIPQTWFAGRIFLSSMLLIAIAKYSFLKNDDNTKIDDIKQGIKRHGLEENVEDNYRYSGTMENQVKPHLLRSNLLLYLVILGVLAGVIAFVSLYIIFPASVLDNYSLHRPYEIPPLFLFLLTLLLFYKKRLYLKKDIIYNGILLYLVVDIFSQIVMSYSTTSFDTAHNIAHVLKDVGYFINIIALVLSNIQYTVNLKEKNVLIRNQYEKIKESERMKSEFINVAAHELRTPIQPILALSMFLSDKKGTLEEYNEHVSIIIKNAKRLQKLAEDILDAAKIESNSLDLNKGKFDLVKLILELIKDYDHQTNGSSSNSGNNNNNNNNNDNNNNPIRLFYEDREINAAVIENNKSNKNNNVNHNNYLVLAINADRNRIMQVLSNIILNSIKYTKKGNINITIIKDITKKEIIVSIKDSGPGIAKEILPNLFNKFITGSSSGTGLGLYISKNIIEAHGGRIWAQNNNEEGKGATFSFSLPLFD